MDTLENTTKTTEKPETPQVAIDPACGCPLKAPAVEASRTHRGLATRLGEWAHARRDFFTSVTGELLFRNVAKIAVGVVPTVLSFMATRHAFKNYNERKDLNSGIHNTIKSLTKMPLVESIVFIFGGFTTLRTFSKIWQRNYDRIFAKSDDASKAIDAISNLPGNIGRDFKDIIPAEVAGTAVAALPLAAIKMGFKNPGKLVDLKGDFAEAKKGFVNDWLSGIPAYLAFFEANDRLYDGMTKGKDSPEYYDKIRNTAKDNDTKAHEPSKKKYGVFTEDGPARLVFRRGVSLLLGLAPYMATQRFARATFGEVNLEKNGFWNNLLKDYGAHIGFATYTATSELYTKGYDELFKRLEAKENDKSLSA